MMVPSKTQSTLEISLISILQAFNHLFQVQKDLMIELIWLLFHKISEKVLPLRLDSRDTVFQNLKLKKLSKLTSKVKNMSSITDLLLLLQLPLALTLPTQML